MYKAYIIAVTLLLMFGAPLLLVTLFNAGLWLPFVAALAATVALPCYVVKHERPRAKPEA